MEKTKKKARRTGVHLSTFLGQEDWNRKVTVQAGLVKKQGSLSKILDKNRAVGMAQAIEHLPNQHKASSLNLSTHHKKSLETEILFEYTMLNLLLYINY
jgi:hypothetical protein